MTDAEESPVPAVPWWRRRRRWAVAAGALAVVVSAGVLGLVDDGDDPEDVVAGYLDVLRSRDLEGALRYADGLAPIGDRSRDLLVREAMTGDWEVTGLARRHTEDDHPATVDVDITAADGTSREGRFWLAKDGEGAWRLLNPLVKLTVAAVPADFVEFNGVSTKADDLWVFPGAYSAYASLGGVMSAPTYVAVPAGGDGRTGYEDIAEQDYLPLFGFPAEHGAALQSRLNTWLDTCAATTEPNPADCPFAAGYGDFGGDVSLFGGDDFETETVTWEVVSYPVVRLKQVAAYFIAVTVEPGELRISGEGTELLHPERGPRKFAGSCGIHLDFTTVRLTAGGFAFAAEAYTSTCANPY